MNKSFKRLGLIFAVALILAGCAVRQASGPCAEAQKEASPEEKWGVKVLGVRLTAAGYMLDFRYRVLDSEKAAEILKRKNKPYLIDQSTGARLMVPSSPKIGPLRQSALKPEEDRNYFVLFANPGRLVKPGGLVTVVVGDFRAENIAVQ